VGCRIARIHTLQALGWSTVEFRETQASRVELRQLKLVQVAPTIQDSEVIAEEVSRVAELCIGAGYGQDESDSVN
jgi:hypothetical protein